MPITKPTIGKNAPDMNTPIEKTAKKRNPNVLSMTFLMGLLASKWWISHERKRIRIYLPKTKSYLIYLLKEQFGGTAHIVNRDSQHGMMWQATSTKSFRAIEKAVLRLKSGLPIEFQRNIKAFLAEHL